MPKSSHGLTGLASVAQNPIRVTCIRSLRFPADILISLEQGIASRNYDWQRAQFPAPTNGGIAESWLQELIQVREIPSCVSISAYVARIR